MELGRVISPEAVREALDLAREEFFAANKLSRADAEKFVEATEFAPFSGAMLAGSRIVWACRDGGKLRGMLALDSAREIILFFVSHDFRRHGIGRALVAAACEYALESGTGELCVFAPIAHEHFFMQLGFERCGEEYARGGIRGVDMRCDASL